MHRIAFTTGLICLGALAAPADAQTYPLKRGFSFDPTETVISTRVPYADLDMTSAAGARELLARIKAAADAVCPPTAEDTRAARDARAECKAMAVANAISRMRNPALSALAAAPSATRRAQW